MLFIGVMSCRSMGDGTSGLREFSEPAAIPLAEAPPRVREQYEATGSKFMVVSQGVETTKAARRMFELGGNAVDAATAASFAIAV
jgi:gamma-glutamyltranspeptidase